jgi:hypothetical protein
MPKLSDFNHTVMAEGRDRLGLVQCVRPFLEAPWQESATRSQDGCDQESESRQKCGTRAEEEGLDYTITTVPDSKLTICIQHSLDANGMPTSRSEAGTPPPGHQNHRRVSHKNSSGDSDRSNSPISRTATPGMQHPTNIAPQHMFDHASLNDHPFTQSPSLPAMHLRHPSPGSISLNERHLEPPPTYDVLLAQNTTLKTRVSELEVINDLFRGRVQELEQNDRRSQLVQDQLRQALDDSKARESSMKRRLDDLEREVSEMREANHLPHAKRQRMTEGNEYPEPPQPTLAAI